MISKSIIKNLENFNEIEKKFRLKEYHNYMYNMVMKYSFYLFKSEYNDKAKYDLLLNSFENKNKIKDKYETFFFGQEFSELIQFLENVNLNSNKNNCKDSLLSATLLTVRSFLTLERFIIKKINISFLENNVNINNSTLGCSNFRDNTCNDNSENYGFNDYNLLHFTLAFNLIQIVNFIIDDFKKSGKYSHNMFEIAKCVNFPEYIVEIRHKCTHKQIPNLSEIIYSLFDILMYLINNVWEVQSINSEKQNLLIESLTTFVFHKTLNSFKKKDISEEKLNNEIFNNLKYKEVYNKTYSPNDLKKLENIIKKLILNGKVYVDETLILNVHKKVCSIINNIEDEKMNENSNLNLKESGKLNHFYEINNEKLNGLFFKSLTILSDLMININKKSILLQILNILVDLSIENIDKHENIKKLNSIIEEVLIKFFENGVCKMINNKNDMSILKTKEYLRNTLKKIDSIENKKSLSNYDNKISLNVIILNKIRLKIDELIKIYTNKN